MNKQTRTQIAAISSKLSVELEKLREIFENETKKLDNIPGNLLYSERFEQMEEDNDNLSQCVDDLEIIVDTLEDIANN